MASESPTRIMSTPASSAMRPPGASYAVTMTRGSAPFATLLARTAGAVTREPMGLPPTVQRHDGCRRLRQRTPPSGGGTSVGGEARQPAQRAPVAHHDQRVEERVV